MSTAIAPRPERFIANIYNPKIAVRLDADGFAHQICEWVRLFADTDLYSAKQPNYEIWGPGVAKICRALGARVTPLIASPDPISGKHKPGFRCTYDEVSGVLIKVEQDVLMECRHPKTGSPIAILATGEVDVWHAYLAEMAKLVGQRADVAQIVTLKGKEKLEEEDKAGTWVFYPYSFGTWLALNVAKQAVQEAQGKLREMARPDKVRGFATSKGARLALKQLNLIPMRFSRGAFLKDAAGREYIDLPVVSWVVFDSRERMQAAIDAMLLEQGSTVETTWEAVSGGQDPFEEEDTEPERAALQREVPSIEQLPEEQPEPAPREKVEAKPEPIQAAQPAARQAPARPRPEPPVDDARAAIISEIHNAAEGNDRALAELLDAIGIRSLSTASMSDLQTVRVELRAVLGR